MNLIKKKYCSECGGKIGLLTHIRLRDKSVLCRSCANKTPSYIRKSLKKSYTLQDYKKLLRYVAYSHQKLLPIFRETDKYYKIHLDTNNGLFFLGNKLSEKTLIFRLDKVSLFDIAFKAEGYKESLVNLSVSGKVIMGLELEEPYFYHEEILATGVRTTARKVMYGAKISYDNPRGMDDFLELFLQACETSRETTTFEDQIAQYVPLNKEGPGELQQAMALFMFERLEDITFEQVKSQRNRLIKAFHPDKGEVENAGYAQKINKAYEILIKYAK